MKRHAKKAFIALRAAGVCVIDHGDPAANWGEHFIISGEDRDKETGNLAADYYAEEIVEHENDAGKIMNAGGIRQDVIDILDASGLYAEWIDPGTVGAYDA